MEDRIAEALRTASFAANLRVPLVLLDRANLAAATISWSYVLGSICPRLSALHLAITNVTAEDIHIWNRGPAVLLHHIRMEYMTWIAYNHACYGKPDGTMRIWTTPGDLNLRFFSSKS
ncbi:hypothetical protein AcV7_002497 [Taiwanofungus camphoratus]|nr:hypothetical protein AcV7_002497 [Antrodia cinnamomea]